MPEIHVRNARDQYVVKSNDLIRTKQQHMSLQQMRILYFSISRIHPHDPPDSVFHTTIQEVCTVCGFAANNGYYYRSIKEDFLALTQPEWVRVGDGRIRTIAWFKNVVMDRRSGNISFQFDDFVQQHLFDLRANYTQYRLMDILTFQSKYAIRLYEIIKSFLYGTDGEQYLEHLSIDICFSVEDLKCMLDASGYTSFGVFRLKVIQKAVEEINSKSTDMSIQSMEFEKTGKAITSIVFLVKKKRGAALALAKQESSKALSKRSE